MISPTGPGAAAAGWATRAPQASAASLSPAVASSADAQTRASDEKLQDARSALATLRQVRAGMGRGGKDAAIQRLAELKARLKSLMLLGGDPKTRAREAAAIAREIAAAARDYATGGGSPSDVAAASGAPAPQGDIVQGQAPPSAQADKAPASDAPAVTNGQAPTQAAATGTSPAQDSGPNDADRQFIEEARRLAQQAKAIIDRAGHSDRRAKGPALSHEDAGAGVQALQAIDRAARDLGLDGGSAAALTATSGVAGATISIKA